MLTTHNAAAPISTDRPTRFKIGWSLIAAPVSKRYIESRQPMKPRPRNALWIGSALISINKVFMGPYTFGVFWPTPIAIAKSPAPIKAPAAET
jgi:hypothetical protein